MHIVHLSTSDSAGGAARAAYRVHNGLRRLGHRSTMIVSKRYVHDPDVLQFIPRSDLLSRIRQRRRRRQIAADFEKYEKNLPARYELFTDDRTPYYGDLARQIPADADAVTLHWVAGHLDHESLFEHFATQRRDVPLVWRLADMGPVTGGCHYDQGCGRFTAKCGVCPELGSSEGNDLSRQVWTRKDTALRRLGDGRMHLVATSQWIAGEARRSSLLGRFPVTVIPNALDTDVFRPRDQRFSRDMLNIPQDVPVVLFIAESTKVRRKGFAEVAAALEGMSGIPGLTLVSVGSGKPQLSGSFGHVHVDRIHDDRVLSIAYSAADVFIMPSLQESFGQTVIESMACGTPVVGFASGGIPDMVRPGISGYLAPTGDTAALRDAIVRYLKEPADERRRMGENCRQIVLDEYSFEVQSRKYERLYMDLMGAKAESGK